MHHPKKLPKWCGKVQGDLVTSGNDLPKLSATCWGGVQSYTSDQMKKGISNFAQSFKKAGWKMSSPVSQKERLTRNSFAWHLMPQSQRRVLKSDFSTSFITMGHLKQRTTVARYNGLKQCVAHVPSMAFNM